MRIVQWVIRLISFLTVTVLLGSCEVDTRVYVKNASSEQLTVVYKRSNDMDFYPEERVSLDRGQKEFLFSFFAGGEPISTADCKPFFVEYMMVEAVQGTVLYVQNPTNPDLWDCSVNKARNGCSCLFVVTDEILTASAGQPDNDHVDK